MLTDAKVAKFKPPPKGQQEYPDNKVTGLRLRVGAGGTKTWIFRARAGDRLINKKLGIYPGMDLTDARAIALTLIGAIARSGSADAIERTFGAVAEHWIEKIAKPKNSSWRLQQRCLEMHVFPKWRNRKIVDIRRAEVRDLVEDLEGLVLPNQVLKLIKTILRFALSRDWIDFSPADGIAKPKVERERDRVLSMAETERIWAASNLLGYPFGPYIQLLLLTAQRRSEVSGVRWDDIDLRGAVWILPASETKSERKHVVPLAPAALEVLRSLPRFGPFVFTTDGRTSLQSFAKLKTRLDAYIEADGGAMQSWRLHDLRRSAATHMVRLGVREEVVGRVLNHAVTGITARVYALHKYGPEKRHALEVWAEEVGRATGAPSPERGDAGGNG